MIGVDYDLFWTLNPKLLAPFIKAFSLRQEYDNAMAWTNGMYIRLAIASSFDKNTKYPNRPIGKEPKEVTQEEIRLRFLDRMKVLNSRFRKE